MPILPFALLICLVCCLSLPCMAADESFPDASTPASPASVQLSPSGGLLRVEQELPLIRQGGTAVISFVLPAGSENLRLQVPGQTIAGWSSVPQVIERTGALSRREARLKAEKADIEQQRVRIGAQMALWQERPETAKFSYEDMAAIEKKLAEGLPVLQRELARLDQRHAQVAAELEGLETNAALGSRVRVVLDGPVQAETVRAEYSYTLADCGWEPVYSFAARTEKGDANGIDVGLMARVWQRSGIDWQNAQITLVTRGAGPREPSRLPRWELAARQPIESTSRARSGMGTMAVPVDAAAVPASRQAAAAPAHAAVRLVADGVYARWELAARGLSEGSSRLLITEAKWPAPLFWLARPGQAGRTNNQVWLVAKYELPAGQVWPAGQAEFSVDGQSVGTGDFTPQKGEAELFFGPDPRVTLSVTDDDKKRGQSGFFDKRRHWSWAWTYTFTNRHAKAVTVRVERPDPLIVDEKITVSHEDEPAARVDAKEHRLFWELAVPAGGTTSLRHGLTVSAPDDYALNPAVP